MKPTITPFQEIKKNLREKGFLQEAIVATKGIPGWFHKNLNLRM